MQHFLPRCAAACLLLASATAQTPGPRAMPVRAPIADGGTLHLATGVWTEAPGRPGARFAAGKTAASLEHLDREARPAPLGETVFNNDAPQPYFLSMRRGEQVADFGRIPAETPATASVGTAQGQTMNGFQFAYTTREVRGQFGYVVSFYDDYGPDSTPERRKPVARIRLLDLPGAPAPGVEASWKVSVNLRHSPYEFVLGQDDGEGGADARFGWSLSCTSVKHGPGGPILAGDPQGDFGPAADAGVGTSWRGDAGRPGTGLGSEDAFWRHGRVGAEVEKTWVTDLEDAPISFNSFHLQLYADDSQAMAASSNIGTSYCEGSSQPVLFHEDFSSVNLSAGGWTYTYPVSVAMGGGWTGGFHARLGRGGTITKALSTEGYDTVSVLYSSEVFNPASNQWMSVHWWNGSNWNQLELTQQTGWRTVSFDLPPEAAGLPDFRIRFRFAGVTSEPGPYWASVDDVWILGSSIGHIEAFGSTSVADNDISLVASGLPVGSFGMFFYGPESVYTPLGIGFRCVGGGGQQRLLPLLQANAAGAVVRDLDFTTHPIVSSFIVDAPVTANFQYWHRKNGHNTLTDALRIHLTE